MNKKPNIVFFGYNQVGYQCLQLLLERGDNIATVYTHADDPNENVWFQSVATLARENSLPVFTPDRLNTPDEIAALTALNPDLIISCYYRNMISEAILALPTLGAVNMHGSLLPRYRGRCPINWAVLHGETETGATLHHMVRRADAGDIVDQEAVSITLEDTAATVFNKVVDAARVVLTRQIDALLAGTAPRVAQDDDQASYFGGRRPNDGLIDWHQSASTLYNLIRAVTHPYPGAFTHLNAQPGSRLIIWQATPLTAPSQIDEERLSRQPAEPGDIVNIAPLQVQTGTGLLQIDDWTWPDQGPDEVAPKLEPGMQLVSLPIA